MREFLTLPEGLKMPALKKGFAFKGKMSRANESVKRPGRIGPTSFD